MTELYPEKVVEERSTHHLCMNIFSPYRSGGATAAGAEALPKPTGAFKCSVKIEKSTRPTGYFGVKMSYYSKQQICDFF